MNRPEAIDLLKDTYQVDPTQGSRWIETSDIEETIDMACIDGRALLAGHAVTWQEGIGYQVTRFPEPRVHKPHHIPVKAADLRKGDLIRIGVSTNYILAAEVTEADGYVEVFCYAGDVVQDKTYGPALRLRPGASVSLSARDLGPRDTVTR